MIKTRFFILLLIGSASGWLGAQTPRAFEQAAMAAFEVRDYYAAFKYYGKVLEMEPARTDVMVKYADAARLYGAFKDAEVHYETALNADNAAGGKYHTALFGLATVKKNLGKYEEALALFERYASRPDSDPDLSRKAANEISECEWAMEKITNPDRLVTLTPLDASINTGDSEMGIVRRGDTTYYGALRSVEWGDKHIPARPLLQIMMALPGKASVPAVFNAIERHTALPAFSPDGRIMIIPIGDYLSETEVRCDLYFTKLTNGQWSAPVKLPDAINAPEATQTQPTIVSRNDGYFDLFYVSDAPGGKGGKDIWTVRFSGTGSFGKPENLSALNTIYDEATPFFDVPNSTLFFSSNGYQNLGGFDIYKVKKVNETWKQVKHLPVPINSSYNDLFYVPFGENAASMTSNRIGAAVLGEESCCYDLFKVTYQNLKLNVSAFEKETETPLSEVVFTLIEEQKDPKVKYVAADNFTDFKINRDKSYKVLAAKDGYFQDTVVVSSLDIEPHKTEIKERLHLRPMQVDLAVKVFNEFSKEPLNGVNIYLYEQTGHIRDERNTGLSANESGLKADSRQGYMIVAQKEGFAPDTIMVSAEEMSKPGTKVIKNLFLTPASMYGLLPLAIYFDNNIPPRSSAEQIQSYALNYESYMARREEFVQMFTMGLATAEEKAAATARLNGFFDNEVKGGFLKLEHFAENLDLFLMNGYEVEIMVKGFASPLASQEYNLALTRRRIVSVKNYLRTAKGGVYESYILNKQLKISTAPMGETAVAAGVNDSWKQREQSVFSVEASKERRAEIIEVRLNRINK